MIAAHTTYRRRQLGDTSSDLAALAAKSPALLSQVISIVNKVENYLPTIAAAADDPALPALMNRVEQLKALENPYSAAPAASNSAAPTPTGPQNGVGLNRVLPLFDAAIVYEKYPWAPWAILAGTVVVLGGAGFALGRWSTRRHEKVTHGMAGHRRRTKSTTACLEALKVLSKDPDFDGSETDVFAWVVANYGWDVANVATCKRVAGVWRQAQRRKRRR